MACAIARIRGSVHLTWSCRRRRWMLSKQSAYALERSCSTGRACRIKRGWRRGWRAALVGRGAPCWPKFAGEERSGRRLGLPRASTVGWEEPCACRGVGGDPTGPWPCHWHARITQGRRVGELEPELYFLAVSGQFHDLVKRRKNRLRASRAPSGGPSRRAHLVGNAQRARRCLAGLARGTESGRAKCT